jgi:hypothetical protein
MAKAMPQNGFLSLSWIKIKDIEKTQSSYLFNVFCG